MCIRDRVYTPDPEIEHYLVYLCSPVYTQTAYQLETNEPILFGLTSHCILGKIKAALPKSIWVRDPVLVPPIPLYAANLRVDQQSIAQRSFDIDAQVTTSRPYDDVTVQWAAAGRHAFWVALSDQCCACIENNTLLGFFVFLDSRRFTQYPSPS